MQDTRLYNEPARPQTRVLTACSNIPTAHQWERTRIFPPRGALSRFVSLERRFSSPRPSNAAV
jgi:hypothetical protein